MYFKLPLFSIEMDNTKKYKYSGDSESEGCIQSLHPLSPRWVLWLWVADRNKEWTQCMEQQCLIKSVEDFIALKYRIIPPSRLPNELNYFVFKEGIKPMWEDQYNYGGGTIDILIGRQFQHTRLDRYWFELLMACLGAQFDEHNKNICGISIRVRTRGYALSVWVTDVSTVKAYAPIIEILEAKLGIGNDASVSITLNKHPTQGGANGSGSYVKEQDAQ